MALRRGGSQSGVVGWNRKNLTYPERLDRVNDDEMDSRTKPSFSCETDQRNHCRFPATPAADALLFLPPSAIHYLPTDKNHQLREEGSGRWLLGFSRHKCLRWDGVPHKLSRSLARWNDGGGYDADEDGQQHTKNRRNLSL